MTTPNIEELVTYLRGFSIDENMTAVKANRIADTVQAQAERIKALELDLDVQAGSIEAAQTVNARQAERIKELEAAPQVGYFYKWKEAMHGIARLMDERDTLRAQLAAIAATEPVLVVEKEPDYWSGGHFHEGSKPHIKPTKVWCLPVGTKLYTNPMPAKPQDHEIRELVDRLTAIAKGYGQTQQLRERIAQEIRPFTFTKPAQDGTELVEALEKLARLGNGEHYGNSDGNLISVGITIVAAIFGMIALLVWTDDRSGQREHELKMKGKK